METSSRTNPTDAARCQARHCWICPLTPIGAGRYPPSRLFCLVARVWHRLVLGGAS